jgi:hypothetical protein
VLRLLLATLVLRLPPAATPLRLAVVPLPLLPRPLLPLWKLLPPRLRLLQLPLRKLLPLLKRRPNSTDSDFDLSLV